MGSLQGYIHQRKAAVAVNIFMTQHYPTFPFTRLSSLFPLTSTPPSATLKFSLSILIDFLSLFSSFLMHEICRVRTYQKPWKKSGARNEECPRQSNGRRWQDELYGAWSGRIPESADERHQVSTAGLDSRRGGPPLIWRPLRLLDERSTSALTSRRRIKSAIKPNLMPNEQRLSTAYAQH